MNKRDEYEVLRRLAEKYGPDHALELAAEKIAQLQEVTDNLICPVCRRRTRQGMEVTNGHDKK